ncbi:unnamed protein product [Colias eurytheme]|nr:unnamed protein product [Colias eurytheme]
MVRAASLLRKQILYFRYFIAWIFREIRSCDGSKLFYPYLKTSSLQRDFLFASGSDESGCEADMLESAEVGRHSPSRPQQEPINLKNEVTLNPLLNHLLSGTLLLPL